jgi:hypothetical protein
MPFLLIYTRWSSSSSIVTLSLIRRTACARAQFSGCSSMTNAHSETGQIAVCCQNLTLGALSSRSAPYVLVGALFKKVRSLFEHASYPLLQHFSAIMWPTSGSFYTITNGPHKRIMAQGVRNMKQAPRSQTVSMEHSTSVKHYTYISTTRQFKQKLWDPFICFVYELCATVRLYIVC